MLSQTQRSRKGLLILYFGGIFITLHILQLFSSPNQIHLLEVRMHSSTASKNQPWKASWPPAEDNAAQVELTPEEMDLQRSYGTHASNTKGKIFAIDSKSQPWKASWPPVETNDPHVDLTPEDMNIQRSYGTHASNTKGKIFAIDNKPKCKHATMIDLLMSSEYRQPTKTTLNRRKLTYTFFLADRIESLRIDTRLLQISASIVSLYNHSPFPRGLCS
jgi:hypothetical protein